MVQQFVRGHGMARLHMRAALWYQILDLVEHGEADLGICPWDRGTPHRAALHYETLFELPLLLLTDAEHPLRRKKVVRGRDLVEHPFIAEPKETCDYKVLLRMLGRDNVSEEQLNIVMIAHTVEMTLRYVARGVGIGLSHVDPRTCKQVPNVCGRVFDPGLEKLPFALVIRRNSHRTALVDEFCAAVRKTLAK
jgi:DNA-binding transcriptional LysR family regulator